LKAERGSGGRLLAKESCVKGWISIPMIEPKDRELIARHKALPDCFLWMAQFQWAVSRGFGTVEDVAGCFEAAAMAVALLRQVIENGRKYRGFLEKAIDLNCRGPSALRWQSKS